MASSEKLPQWMTELIEKGEPASTCLELFKAMMSAERADRAAEREMRKAEMEREVRLKELELREKPDRIPKELLGYSDVVLDGYCNPIEIQTSAFVLEPVYLKCYRRRWKRSGESIHY